MKRDTVVECALRPGGLPDYVCENEQRSAIYSVADSVQNSQSVRRQVKIDSVHQSDSSWH